MDLVSYSLALLLSLSLITETFGAWARVIGSYNHEPTLGYSVHVRIATLGRCFTFISAPLLGFLVDGGAAAKEIAIIGSISFLIVAIAISLFITICIKHFNSLYALLNASFPNTPVYDFSFSINQAKNNKKFIFINFLAFGMSAVGIVMVNMIASIFPLYRAMIVQLAAGVTAFGTLLHVFKIDPEMSYAADINPLKLHELVSIHLVSRLFCSLALSIIFFIIAIFI